MILRCPIEAWRFSKSDNYSIMSRNMTLPSFRSFHKVALILSVFLVASSGYFRETFVSHALVDILQLDCVCAHMRTHWVTA